MSRLFPGLITSIPVASTLEGYCPDITKHAGTLCAGLEFPLGFIFITLNRYLMLRRKTNTFAPAILMVLLFAIPFAIVTEQNKKKTQEEIRNLNREIDELRQDFDSLRISHLRLRERARQSKIMLRQTADQLGVNRSTWLSYFSKSAEDITRIEQQSAALKKRILQRRNELETALRELEQVLMDTQDQLGQAPLDGRRPAKRVNNIR